MTEYAKRNVCDRDLKDVLCKGRQKMRRRGTVMLTVVGPGHWDFCDRLSAGIRIFWEKMSSEQEEPKTKARTRDNFFVHF